MGVPAVRALALIDDGRMCSTRRPKRRGTADAVAVGRVLLCPERSKYLLFERRPGSVRAIDRGPCSCFFPLSDGLRLMRSFLCLSSSSSAVVPSTFALIISDYLERKDSDLNAILGVSFFCLLPVDLNVREVGG